MVNENLNQEGKKSGDRTCPDCGKEIGERNTCPYCETDIRKRTSHKILVILSVIILAFGTFYYVAQAQGKPKHYVKIGQIDADLNYGYAWVDGTVSSGPTYREYPSKRLEFSVYDGTGEISIRAYSEEADEIVENGRVPSVGDKVEVFGQIRVEDYGERIDLQSTEKFKLTRTEPKESTVSEVRSEFFAGDKYKKVTTTGILTDLRAYGWMNTYVIEDPETGEPLEVFASGGLEKLGPTPPEDLSLYSELKITGGVSEYQNSPQLSIRNYDKIKVIGQAELPEVIPRHLFSTTEGGMSEAMNPKYLFSAEEAGMSENMNQSLIPQELENEFEKENHQLSESASLSVEENNKKWKISDKSKFYPIKKEGDKLNIYKQSIPQELENEFEKENHQLSESASLSVEENNKKWKISDKNNIYIVKKENDKLNIQIPFSSVGKHIGDLIGTRGKIVFSRDEKDGHRFWLDNQNDSYSPTPLWVWDSTYKLISDETKSQLKRGARIKVYGEAQRYEGRNQVELASPPEISILDNSGISTYSIGTVNAGDIDNQDVGNPVTVEGTAEQFENQGKQFTISDATGEVDVSIPSKVWKIMTESPSEGDTVSVTGMVEKTDGNGLIIRPGLSKDIEVIS